MRFIPSITTVAPLSAKNVASHSASENNLSVKMHTRPASITVTLTLVLMLVIALQLVTLEHAYQSAGKTLALQSFDKTLESAISSFYSPLYTEYGLLALPVGTGFDYRDSRQVEAAIRSRFNGMYEAQVNGKSAGLWDFEINNVAVSKEAYLTSADGAVFLGQIKDDLLCEGALYLEDALMKLADGGFGSVRELFESEKKDAVGNSSDEEEWEAADVSARSVWETLKTFLVSGLPGFWFEDIAEISTKRLRGGNLPSRTEFGLDVSNADDDLFAVPSLDKDEIEDGSYYDKLVSSDFFENFSSAFSQIKDSAGDKFAMIAYSNLHMDNYVKNDYKAGALNYEQEYLIYGTTSDNVNVRRASWSIFGIRMSASLLYLLTSEERQEELDEWLSKFNVTPKLKAALKVLVTMVWAMQNALVETAALLKGQKVNFTVSDSSLSVRLSEILAMTKENIKDRAENYKKGGKAALSYSAYLDIFMFMTDKDRLCYRLMDIIEVNIQKSYNPSFKLNKSLVGFSCSAGLSFSPKFTGIAMFGGGNGKYEYTLESAVMMR